MIFAFSSSSPWPSLAVISPEGFVLWEGQEHAPQQASSTLLRLLEGAKEAGFELNSATMFAADTGPGSFTGVRVAVVLAKTFAFVFGKQVLGASAFDLIDAMGTAIVPSKKGEYFIRELGEEPYRSQDLPVMPYQGYGNGLEPSTPPQAKNFASLIDKRTPQDPYTFAPDYLIDPSISLPKKPFRSQGVPVG